MAAAIAFDNIKVRGMKFDHLSDEDAVVELRTRLLQGSVRFGDFKLSSGQSSDVYVDAKLTTCSARAMPLVGQVFLWKIKTMNWRPTAVGGLTIGADPIAFAIARESLRLTDEPINAFIVRKEPKKHGMQRFIEGCEETGGLNVVIVDDVCSTGDSTAKAILQARESGMNVLGAVCLVDREMGAAEQLREKFGCQLESIFKLSELRANNDRPVSATAVFEPASR
jgi:orotate phosphoribosyltransferase